MMHWKKKMRAWPGIIRNRYEITVTSFSLLLWILMLFLPHNCNCYNGIGGDGQSGLG